jgi:3-dehydroquinate dehydratase-2
MAERKRILIINGPNLNLLGTREPDIYGSHTLDDVKALLQSYAEDHGMDLEFFQSNSEGEIIDFMQRNRNADGIIINPAALTHTSIAIRDSLAAIGVPAIEAHLSNIHAREEFRRVSFTAPVCIGQISYLLALEALEHFLKGHSKHG